VLACDVAEKMLQRVQDKYPVVRTYHADIAWLDLASTSLDAIFMNGMYGNIADKPAACRNAARMLRSGGRLVQGSVAAPAGALAGVAGGAGHANADWAGAATPKAGV
jgi:ubiquinone/menaquinone biosynthesis C-methylase UbiE